MKLRRIILSFAVILALQPSLPPARGAAPGAPPRELTLPAAAKELALSEGLALGPVGLVGRRVVPTDLLAWQMAAGTMAPPAANVVVGPNDKGEPQSWAPLKAGDDGWFQGPATSGGYLYFVVTSARARTMIFEASGFYVARVNGQPRAGEKYGKDWVRHPVRLAAGRNEFLIKAERGRFRGRLVEPRAPVFFTDADMTLPDVVLGEKGPFWAGLRLVNATGDRLERIEVVCRDGGRDVRTSLDVSIAPFMTQKLAVPLAVFAPPSAAGQVRLEIRARARAGRRIVETPPLAVELKAVPPTAHHVRTFVSAVDRSVQFYGVAPKLEGGTAPAPGTRPALVLSLHGAGVEADGQARAYKSKDWAYIAAATNRRAFGFDWEDWGRLDALEVLADASRLFGTDPDRTYLTGHSMGGHGTWQIGATLPDLWAAIAPSAGWYSFSSYGSGVVYKNPTPVERMLARANDPSETTELARNFLHYGVYILHGDQDDDVPVEQARFMRELLGKFHPDFCYYERPGAGHWWGAECVDWPPLFAFLKERVRPAATAVKRIEFATADPGISSRSRWLEILAQAHPLEYSRITVERDGPGANIKGTTENVLRLAFDVSAPPAGGALTIELDGSRLTVSPPAGANRVFLERGPDGWRAGGPPGPERKNPRRSSGFKSAFGRGVVFVYGTRGDADDDALAFDKARFDAEMFWARGNNGVEVLPDAAFDPAEYPDRSIILYGNADTNAAWSKLLPACPVDIRNGRARAGDKRWTGADIAAYFVRPRPGSAVASVGAVAWTGKAGWLAASPAQYFISGAGFPDLLILSAESLRAGTAGVRAVGWFGDDWSLEKGDVAWNEPRPVE